MKHIISSLLLGLSISANSQSLPIVCDSLENVNKVIQGQHKEEIIWVGKENDTGGRVSILFQNPSTGTWTFIFFKGNEACMLAAGIESNIFTNKPSPTPKTKAIDPKDI